MRRTSCRTSGGSEEEEEQEERFHVAPNMEAGDPHLQATLHQEAEEERQEKEQLEEDRKACVCDRRREL